MNPWIKVSTALARHPKTITAAARLGIGLPEMVGRLVALWTYAAEFRPSGVFASAAEVAAALGFSGVDPRLDAEAIAAALSECPGYDFGFLEPGDGGRLKLHDWNEYSGAGFAAAPVSRAARVKVTAEPEKIVARVARLADREEKRREENKIEEKKPAIPIGELMIGLERVRAAAAAAQAKKQEVKRNGTRKKDLGSTA